MEMRDETVAGLLDELRRVEEERLHDEGRREEAARFARAVAAREAEARKERDAREAEAAATAKAREAAEVEAHARKVAAETLAAQRAAHEEAARLAHAARVATLEAAHARRLEAIREGGRGLSLASALAMAAGVAAVVMVGLWLGWVAPSRAAHAARVDALEARHSAARLESIANESRAERLNDHAAQIAPRVVEHPVVQVAPTQGAVGVRPARTTRTTRTAVTTTAHDHTLNVDDLEGEHDVLGTDDLGGTRPQRRR